MKHIKLFISIALIFLLTACATKAPQTKVIAHRGFWRAEGAAQNTVKSMQMANAIKAYGSECDIWLTGDDQMMLFHDGHFKLNGKKYTVYETSGDTLRKLELLNGEHPSTLEEFLTAFKACKETKLIIELKNYNEEPKQTLAVEKTLAMVKAMGLEKRVEYISFSRFLCQEIIRLNPKAKVAYLNGELSPKELKELGFTGLDYYYSIIRDNPQWLKEAHQLGLTVNVWTVDSEEDLRQMVDMGVDFITTDYPELLQQILQEKKQKK